MNHKLTFFLLSVFLTKACLAQFDYDLLSDPAQEKTLIKIEKIKDVDTRFKVIKNTFDSSKITIPKYLGDLYSERAFVYWEKYGIDSLDSDKYQNGSKTGSTIIKQILTDYQLAIKTNSFHEPLYRLDRMNFLDELNPDHPLVEQDLVYLKQHGYKEEFSGLSPGINYMHGKYNWVGVDVSAYEFVSPHFALKNKDSLDGKLKRVNDINLPAAFAFLSIGFNQSLINSAHEFTISGLRVTAPLYLEVTKFGFESGLTAKQPLWFYRPEIGIGNSFISVGYAYNFLFSKKERSHWEKSLFVIKLCYPIIRYK